ncbi:MAG: transcriptional repressor NrdR [Lachnospiraceae bacterium]|nr:transcriptional repressor NrdR [Lachnospiraceae bacterium]
MRCPYCNDENLKVIDSRPMDEDNAIRRRRQCESCGKRFTTFEKVETIPLMVVKKDNTREPYNRSKIEKGVLSACHKRPVSVEDINGMIDSIEAKLFQMDSREISSTDIGELVMDNLKNLDEVAYVRFSSVYREFTDVHTFMKELEKLYKKKKR